jgi:hypothetical protein
VVVRGVTVEGKGLSGGAAAVCVCLEETFNCKESTTVRT